MILEPTLGRVGKRRIRVKKGRRALCGGVPVDEDQSRVEGEGGRVTSRLSPDSVACPCRRGIWQGIDDAIPKRAKAGEEDEALVD